MLFAYSELHWTLEAGLQRVSTVHESGLFLCKHSARVRFTFVSAQCVSPSSCITVSTFSFLSFEDKDEGRRRDAENRKFSRTVKVPMTISSCNTNTTVSYCNINTTQHHHPISTLLCSIYTRQQHLSILTQHTIVITTWTQYNIVLRYKHNTILQYQNNILS